MSAGAPSGILPATPLLVTCLWCAWLHSDCWGHKCERFVLSLGTQQHCHLRQLACTQAHRGIYSVCTVCSLCGARRSTVHLLFSHFRSISLSQGLTLKLELSSWLCPMSPTLACLHAPVLGYICAALTRVPRIQTQIVTLGQQHLLTEPLPHPSIQMQIGMQDYITRGPQ